MVRLRKRGEEIRKFILDNIEKNQKDISSITSDQFTISRQAVNKHMKRLIDQKAIQVEGKTKNRKYTLIPISEEFKVYKLNGLLEDVVWREDIYPMVKEFPDNVIEIWGYCFTEMLNNAIDHSSGANVSVHVTKTAVNTDIMIYDDGEGIFKKIQRQLHLLDESHAILELSKGKLTTDPSKHTGEGIFFTSRILDSYSILSGENFFSHQHPVDEDWILRRKQPGSGTGVFMKMDNNISRTLQSIFNKFTTEEDYGFNKTIIPVRLARYGDELLVSRSQAKRLLVRFEKFKTVILDFSEVSSIGQSFADEIFRVFKLQNQEIELLHINANKEVEQMIVHAVLNKE